MSWRESDFMEKTVKDGLYFFLAGVVAFFVMLAVSCVLDLATPCPTWLWVLIWTFGVVFTTAFFPAAYYSHPNNRIDVPEIKRTMQSYGRLPKDEKRLIPTSAIKTMTDKSISLAQRREVAREVSALIYEINESKTLNDSTVINSILDDVRATREGLRESNNTYKELMR